MEDVKTFEILLDKNVPYVTRFLSVLILACCLGLFLFYLIMLPSTYSSQEASTTYFMKVVPDFMLWITAISFIGLLIFYPLYYLIRLKEPALLSFTNTTVEIKSSKLTLVYRKDHIERINCNYLGSGFFRKNEQLQLVMDVRYKRQRVFKLKHYEDKEQVLAELSKLKEAKIYFGVLSVIDDDILTSA